MSFSLKYQQLKSITRAGDWRFSFIPHVFGNLYLWMLFLEIEANTASALLLVMSLFTSFGFAALGYFINEYFDQKEDTQAGKINKMMLISPIQQFFLLIVILLLTFLPWLIIPWDKISVVLIFFQIFLFFIYSLPIIRLKRAPVISGLIDAAYAYIVPMLLSFYSFFLFSEKTVIPEFIFYYAFLLLLVGFRNISIHQINDIFKDKKVGIKSLPMILGVKKTNVLLQIIIATEFISLIALSIYLFHIHQLFLLLFGVLIFYFYQIILFYNQSKDKIIVNRPIRHLTDNFYQVWFPLLTLLILVSIDVKWLIVLPFHVLLLIDFDRIRFYINWIIDIVFNKFIFSFLFPMLKNIWFHGFKPFLGYFGNHIIYFSFKIFGVDLKKENISALAYLKSKWGM